jgi:hypothetical protein
MSALCEFCVIRDGPLLADQRNERPAGLTGTDRPSYNRILCMNPI